MKQLARPLRGLASRFEFSVKFEPTFLSNARSCRLSPCDKRMLAWLLNHLNSTIKEPSAWIPLAMSLAALATVLIHIAIFGVVHEADEGTAAHIWQILMAGQVPFVAFFAIKWLFSAPKQALMILGLQIVAVLAACAPVFLFKS